MVQWPLHHYHFVQGNEKVLTASPNYWNAANVKRFNTITIKMLESDDTAYTMFLTGEIDNVTLTQSNLSTIYNNESNEFHQQPGGEPSGQVHLLDAVQLHQV